MANHTKPTKEELEANIKKSTEDLDKLDETPQVTPPQEEVAPEVEEISQTPQEEVVEEENKEEEETPQVEEPQEEESEDYKKKFQASSREAQKIAAKNRKLNQAISDAGEIPEPTDEELEKEYPDWEVMSTTEQQLAKDNLINKRRFDLIHKGVEESKRIEKWGEDVDSFIEDPQTLVNNPELEGKQDEFRLFANDPAYHGSSFKLLVSAFLREEETKSKSRPKNKGKMFEVGSGGPKDKPKPKGDTLTVAEGRLLMKTDYKAWKEKLLQGKIANE